MNRPRLLRALRITWTVLCGIACVLLIALWVRSYWWEDGVSSQFKHRMIDVESICGEIVISKMDVQELLSFGIKLFSGPVDDFRQQSLPRTLLGFGYSQWSSQSWDVLVPHWFPVLLFAALSAAPWLRCRFSLRTLLIATTLVAVVLGLAMYFSTRATFLFMFQCIRSVGIPIRGRRE